MKDLTTNYETVTYIYWSVILEKSLCRDLYLKDTIFFIILLLLYKIFTHFLLLFISLSFRFMFSFLLASTENSIIMADIYWAFTICQALFEGLLPESAYLICTTLLGSRYFVISGLQMRQHKAQRCCHAVGCRAGKGEVKSSKFVARSEAQCWMQRHDSSVTKYSAKWVFESFLEAVDLSGKIIRGLQKVILFNISK